MPAGLVEEIEPAGVDGQPEAVAAAVGYADAGTLRSLVRRRRNTTLAALRRS